MTFKDYWDSLQKVNPIKDGQKVLLTKEQFYKMQKQAFTKGFFSGTSKVKDAPKSNDWENMFGDIFKNKG